MPIVTFNVDEARYVGDDEDGCYYQAAEGEDGWYVTIVVDCDSAGFVSDHTTDDGPYPSEDDAWEAGRSGSMDWCLEMGVAFDD